jgi:integrase/recombinase XerD
LRAVLRRVNAGLGTNWSMHDLRHTSGLRMVRDERLSLRDVQVILGHAQLLSTTGLYLHEDGDAVLVRVHTHLSAPPVAPIVTPSAGYDREHLAVLFGEAVTARGAEGTTAR